LVKDFRVLHTFLPQDALQRPIQTYIRPGSLQPTPPIHHQSANIRPDPETYTWDPLDSDLLTRLSLRPYVSMSRERRLNIQPTALPMITDPELSDIEQFDLYERLSDLDPDHDPESSLSLPDYISAQDPNTHSYASSIFEGKTPGAMTLQEVASEIELGKWRLQLQRMGRTVTLQVRVIIRGQTLS